MNRPEKKRTDPRPDPLRGGPLPTDSEVPAGGASGPAEGDEPRTRGKEGLGKTYETGADNAELIPKEER